MRRTVRRFVAVAIVVAVVAIALGSLLGQPLGFGSVETGSMAPTMEPGDGYVVVPAGQVGEGDVVVYWSAVSGEYVTHRIVDVADGGYVTKGDANGATDQAAGHPPVPRSAVVAKVLAVGGSPLVIPGLGALVETIQRYRLLALGLLGAAAIGLVIRFRAKRRGRHTGATVLYVRDLVEPALLVGVVLAVALTPLGAGSYQVTYAAAQGASGDYSIPVDEPVTRTVTVDPPETPVTRHVVRAEGMTIVDRVDVGGALELTVSIPPRGVAGPRPTAIHVYPYLDVLPESLLERLHDVHPMAAIAGTVGSLFGALYLLYRLAVDGDRPIVRVRSRWAGLLGGS